MIETVLKNITLVSCGEWVKDKREKRETLLESRQKNTDRTKTGIYLYLNVATN